MKAKTLIFSFIILFFSGFSNLNAQNDPIKWGILKPEDIKMTTYTADPEASAVILCDYGTVTVSYLVLYTKFTRIKILKEAGCEYAKVEIPYRPYGNYEYFSKIIAHTINVTDNGTSVKTKVTASRITDIEIDQRHHKKVITFLDVKPGSFIEYSYELYSLDIVKLTNWYFQSTIPVVWSEYRINIPDKLNYLVTFQKGRNLDYDEQEDYSKRLQYLYSNKLKDVYEGIGGNNNILYESPKKTIKVYMAHGKSLRFVMEKMPGISPKPYNTDIFPFVKVHLYQVENPLGYSYIPPLSAANVDYEVWEKTEYNYNSGAESDTYWLPTWEEATQNWIMSEFLGNRLSEDFNAKGEMDAIAHTDSTNILKGVYQFIKSNIKWDGTYSMYAIREFPEVLDKKSGNSGEINLLLINLLKKVGFKVNPVLIRTSELGRIENLYPEKGQFNDVIAELEINGKIIFLDATSKNDSYLPVNVEHTTGWLLSEKGFKFVEVVNTTQEVPLVGGKQI